MAYSRKAASLVLVCIAVISCVGLAMLPSPATERFKMTPLSKLKAHVQESAQTMLQHLRTYHFANTRVQRLLSTWNGKVVDYEFDRRSIRGSFSKETGVLKLRIRDPDLSDAQLRGILLHEMAHSSGDEHDSEWRETFVFFCNVATDELGWELTLSQPHNCKNYAICSSGDCVECAFETQRSHIVTRRHKAVVEDSWAHRRPTYTKMPRYLD